MRRAGFRSCLQGYARLAVGDGSVSTGCANGRRGPKLSRRFARPPARLGSCDRTHPHLAPHRIHRRIGDAQGRCQGQGAAGRRAAPSSATPPASPTSPPPQHIVEAAVARGARPQEPPVHPRRRPARAARGDRGQDPARQRRCRSSPSQVIVTNGGKQAVYQSFATLLDPGDEVLVPTPYWTTYPEAIKLAGRRARRGVRGRRPELPGDRRAARGGAHRRAPRCCCSCRRRTRRAPCTQPEQTKAIGEWAEAHGLWVISDEIYQNLTYDGVRAVSIVEAVPALADRTILVNGVAKTYAMTGWRLGWMVGPADAIKAAANLQSHLSSNVSNISQRAAIAALTGPQDAVERCARPSTAGARRSSPGSTRSRASSARPPRARSTSTPTSRGCSVASGAASRRPPRSSWPTSSSIRPRSPSVPGEAFGPSGYLRLSYALGDEPLAEGIARLQKLFAV